MLFPATKKSINETQAQQPVVSSTETFTLKGAIMVFIAFWFEGRIKKTYPEILVCKIFIYFSLQNIYFVKFNSVVDAIKSHYSSRIYDRKV